MIHKGRFEKAHVANFSANKEFEVIFDFDDDWHCALKLRREMKKEEVADKLRGLSDLILQQARRG